MTSMMTFCLIVSLVMMALALTTGKNSVSSKEKMSPFECGFSPFKKARVPLSLRFFMISIIFLIFDVEIALLLPMGIAKHFSQPVPMLLGSTLLMAVLIIGLFHEWNQETLNWL
uniref:NADH dehydrogenase subunit 3 n=1 Tax=Charcotia amundseni TaxID=2259499 RepID=UPI001FF43FD2|nr:NADH dehydrogenase subunit 3 [Charcotia amundseni]UIN24684.1 NADH dehydrogenase subunit 3 [Charcotia amundseni]